MDGSSNKEILYKYIPTLPHLRGNLLRILERQSVFFSRKGFLNDPIECEPRIDLEIDDEQIAELTQLASLSTEHSPLLHHGLKQISSEIEKNKDNPDVFEVKYHQGLFGLTKAEDMKTLLGGAGGFPLRDLAKSALKEFCKHQISEPYIFSLSRTAKDPLLWGHYASGHAGVCLGFSGINSKSNAWEKGNVEYSNRRPTISVRDVLSIVGSKPSKEAVHSIFFKKSESWRNEQEVRLVARPQTIIGSTVDLLLPEGAYIPIDGIQLEVVIFGARCSDPDKYAIKTIIEQKCLYNKWPDLLQANFNDGSYDIHISNSNESFSSETPMGPIARALLQGIGTS